MSVKIHYTGIKEIDTILKMMPKELNHQTIGNANAKVGRIVENRAKLLAPEGPTGNLVDSIGVVRTPMKRAGSVGEVGVGPRRSRAYKGHHGHLIEFGFKTRAKAGVNKKNKEVKTFVQGKPFMEPAFHATKSQVLAAIPIEIGRKVQAVMRRYAKR